MCDVHRTPTPLTKHVLKNINAGDKVANAARTVSCMRSPVAVVTSTYYGTFPMYRCIVLP